MKRTIAIATLLVLSCTAFAESRYIGLYTNKITDISSGQSTHSLSNSNYFTNEDETLIIQTIAETIDDNRSKEIKKAHFWAGFSAVTFGLSAMNTTYHVINKDAIGAIRGYTYMNINMANIYDCVQRIGDGETLAISVIYTNNSDKEISIASDGYVFYILPRSSMVIHYANTADIYCRIQTDLNDASTAKRYSISSVANCKKVSVEYENDEYIFASTTNGKLNVNNEFIYVYFRYNKESGDCEYMIKSKMDAMIKEAKKK